MSLVWQHAAFNQLSVDQLYDILKLRVEVFVVEQNCPYPELDNKDRHPHTLHLMATDEQGQLAAYARILPPQLSYPEASIGRIVVAPSFRGQHLGEPLVKQAVALALQHWPQAGIQIGAQYALVNFYNGLGFNSVSEVYLEDDIEHIDMMYQA